MDPGQHSGYGPVQPHAGPMQAHVAPRGPHAGPKSSPEQPRSTPGAPQEHPEAPQDVQEHPRSTREHARSTPGAARSIPGAPQEHPRSIQEHPDIDEIIQEFYFAHPEIKTKINRIYNTSYSGSVLWDLGSENVQKLINSWSVSVRHMWNLPRQASRELIEPLSGTHAKTMLYSRFVQFIQSIQKGSKSAAHFLLELIKNNKETLTGKNIDIILRETGDNDIMDINAKQLKKKLFFKELDEGSKWKIGIIKEQKSSKTI